MESTIDKVNTEHYRATYYLPSGESHWSDFQTYDEADNWLLCMAEFEANNGDLFN